VLLAGNRTACGDGSQADGAYIGLGLELAGDVGTTVGVSWSLGPGLANAYNAIPGFSIGFATGVEVKAMTLQAGYVGMVQLFN
jgi:hypothetical protein